MLTRRSLLPFAGPHGGRLLRRSALIAACATSALLASAQPAAANTGTYGAVLVTGAGWAGSDATLGDLNVYGNGDSLGNAQPGPYGPRYQCTELAIRFSAIRYGESARWAIENAADMWRVGPLLPVPLKALPNGGPTPPQYGDLLIFNSTSYDPTGHVSVVSGVRPGFVDIVEQNWSSSGRASLPINGTTMPTRWGLTILGWLRNPRAAGSSYTPATSGPGGYVLDAFGSPHPYGSAPYANFTAYWPNWKIARGLATAPDGKTGYILDGWGGLHPFAAPGAVMPQQPVVTAYWPGWDIARNVVVRPNGTSGYVLDAYGDVHPWGGAPAVTLTADWPGWDIARSIVLRPDGNSGFVLDGWGGLHPFAAPGTIMPPMPSTSAYWPGWDIARGVTLVPGSNSDGYMVDGWGGLHPFGNAVGLKASGYFPSSDLAVGVTMSDAKGGYVALATGVVLQFGDAPPVSEDIPGLPISRAIS